MQNDLIGQLEVYTTAKDMWDALQVSFAGTSIIDYSNYRSLSILMRWI